MPGLDWSDHVRWLNMEAIRLLEFGRAAGSAPNGFAWLDGRGRPDLEAPLDLWVTSRMTHVFALGALLGHQWCAQLADHGIAALAGPFHDPADGGWFSQIAPDGAALDTTKAAYAHAFVALAASSAAAAARPGAEDLLERALAVQESHFLEAGRGLVVDVFNRDFTKSEDYRGANANMHTVEAYLAAADATGDSRWRGRALVIADWMVRQARELDWRVPEHFTADWRPVLDYNADQPEDQFRPYGATPGHGFEWCRLILELRAALGAEAPDWMRPAAEELFRRAYLDGWQDSPTAGFVYTTDWSGLPVIRTRLHWVAAEAVGAATTAYRATGDPLYQHLYNRWWDMIGARFIDLAEGSWRHEVSPAGEASSQLWEGKPDIYHALQATLIPRLPLAPTLARALRERRLDKEPLA
ncbi:MAG: AGE family epimerase/isomerase [Bifidobacteriaceae bacterium]|jgi:mannose/cellobiose epimerase-like protein (N-acyl-D-glucosamine 2-epimerase family)|nr:AGE family epimerase/isomerase [Bifidobacteriaceae bacterium]